MVTLREATAEDALLISRINAASWRHAYQGVIDAEYLRRLPDDYWLPTTRAWLASGRLYGLIALEDGRPIGSALFGRGRDEAYGDWWELVSIYLLPGKTRLKVGSVLLADAERLMREEGYTRSYVWAIQGNHGAEAFYLRHGYRDSGEHITYRIGSGEVTDVRYIRES